MQASKYMNDRGCITFHHAQKQLQPYRDKLEMGDGIRQNVGECGSKINNTSDKSCDCTFFSTYQAPCMQILFVRDIGNNDVFSPELFYSRYLRSNFSFQATNDEEMLENHDNIDMGSMDRDNDDSSLNDRDRYNIVMTLLIRLGSVISAHSTKQFLEYISNLEDIQQKVRRGER